MSFLNDLVNQNNLTETENGAAALKSTLNHCLDAFGSIGGMMKYPANEVVGAFLPAFMEDRELAMRMLFYFRDVRGGQGMRKAFKDIVVYLAKHYPEYVVNNLSCFPEFGRWDDLLCLIGTPVEDEVFVFLHTQLEKDLTAFRRGDKISLLAKWLPSENASSVATRDLARKIMAKWGMTPKKYRKTLSELRSYSNVVEVKMSANKWSDIDYKALPGKAAILYTDAFVNHDADRYLEYLKTADKMNAGALFPVDIIHQILHWESRKKNTIMLNKMWESLPNYFGDKEETGICMVDTSGSMSGQPYEVALSLGIYCADKCRGPFKNHFITFAEKPELVSLVGDNIVDRVRAIRTINAGNTDIEAAFDLILNAAIANNTPNSDLPKKLYIISDMQFDVARGSRADWFRWSDCKQPNQTFMADMREKYAEHGYDLPNIVYWNVRASKCGMFQDTFDGESCCMVSGYSASLFKSVIDGTELVEEIDHNGNTIRKEKIDPMTVMLNTLNKERYDCVWTGSAKDQELAKEREKTTEVVSERLNIPKEQVRCWNCLSCVETDDRNVKKCEYWNRYVLKDHKDDWRIFFSIQK